MEDLVGFWFGVWVYGFGVEFVRFVVVGSCGSGGGFGG